MRRSTTRILALMVILALAGCDAASGPPGTPGSATIYLHGRAEAGVGAFSR